MQGPAGRSRKFSCARSAPRSFLWDPDALANPTLEYSIRVTPRSLPTTIGRWQGTGGIITSDQAAEINGSGLSPSNDLESAIVANLTPGAYTAVVRGAGDTAGPAVVDAFDLSPASTAQVANIATRGLIQPGDKLMIAGFIVQNGSVRVVIRAIGPSLVAFGIPARCPDTTLQLRDQNGAIVQENDDWMSDQKAELEATGVTLRRTIGRRRSSRRSRRGNTQRRSAANRKPPASASCRFISCNKGNLSRRHRPSR